MLESRLGSRIVMGGKVDKMGKGGCLPSTLQRLGREGCHVGKGKEKKFGRLQCHHMYGR